MKDELKIAVLLPTYDERGYTLDLSFLNCALRMREVQNVAWALFIGVNGTQKKEEVAKVQRLLESHSTVLRTVHTSVHLYEEKCKENAMNQLALAAAEHFGGSGPDMHIGTDVKVYRNPGVFTTLIHEYLPAFRQGRNPRYLGANIVPYPVEVYKNYYPLSSEQELFYTLLEIDKDPDVRNIIPKTHLRGGLYVTGVWQELYTDIPDDFSITRRARKEHGDDAVQVTSNAVGYFIPRQSFADYFTVRLKRSIPAEESLQRLHPELSVEKESQLAASQKESQLDKLKDLFPEKYFLYLIKKYLDKFCRILALDMNAAIGHLDSWSQDLADSNIIVPEIMDLTYIHESRSLSPESIAQVIVIYYRAIVEALIVDPSSIQFGPREERFRGMLPLDIEK